jgi:very-short-patch-repair endonuclease
MDVDEPADEECDGGARRRTRAVTAMTQTARNLRKQATPAEERLWELLRARRCGGYRFQRQIVAGHWVLDFYCPAARLAIEVDGSVHDTPDARLRDRERDAALLMEVHIRTMRLTNSAVLTSSPEALIARILHEIESSLPLLTPPGERPARLR